MKNILHIFPHFYNSFFTAVSYFLCLCHCHNSVEGIPFSSFMCLLECVCLWWCTKTLLMQYLINRLWEFCHITTLLQLGTTV